MLGRIKGPVATISDSAQSVRDYVDPLVRDEKLRRKLAAALAVGSDARRRAKRQTGLSGLARRLATDRVLRAQLAELGAQLQGVQKRAKKAHSHRLRNTVLVVAGAGIAAAAAWKLVAGGDESANTSWDQPPPQQPEGVHTSVDDAQPA